MASPEGTRFETAVEKELKAAGLKVIRPLQTRAVDVGDLWLEKDIVLQAKAWQNLPSALREGVAGAEVQAVHARRPFGFAVIKKPRGAIADAYVAMPLSTFIEFLKSRGTPDE